MGKDIVWEADVECTACGGTGLYKGMAERGKSAVICYRCDGSGRERVYHHYTEFTNRNRRNDVARVYETAGGYCITDVDTDGINFSKAGVTYKEWLAGNQPLPLRQLHCPLQHYGQGTTVGENIKSNCCGDNGFRIGSYIPDCSKKNRLACWEWFDSDYCDKESK